MIDTTQSILGTGSGLRLSAKSVSNPDTLVVGDIHYTGRVRAFFGGSTDGWNEYWKTVFGWIRKIALDNSVKKIIFLGDITDDIPTKFSVAWYMRLFDLFSTAIEGFDVTIVSGNHDMNTDGSYDVLSLLVESLPNVKIDGASAFNYADGSAYRKGEGKVINSSIGYGHDIFGWQNGDFFGIKSIPVSSIFSGKLFITGHIHQPCYQSICMNQTLVNLGSVVPTSADQLNGQRYVMLLNAEDLSYGYEPVPIWEKDWDNLTTTKTLETLKQENVQISLSELQDFWGYLEKNLDKNAWEYLKLKLKEREGK